MQPDFSHLYRAIGVRPECSLDAFRQAFRRHVASRHPDRTDDADDAGTGADGVLPLAEINALYAMARRFHRRHGRLPGAAPAPGRPPDRCPTDPPCPTLRPKRLDPPRAAAVRPASAQSAAPVPPAADPAPARRWGRWLVVAALVVVAIGFWRAPTHPARTAARATDVDARAAQDALPARLAIGMSPETVRAIQGEPLHRRGGEWDYGPSWLRFERGRLVDWYSSPLNRLKTATDSPQAGTASDTDPQDPTL